MPRCPCRRACLLPLACSLAGQARPSLPQHAPSRVHQGRLRCVAGEACPRGAAHHPCLLLYHPPPPARLPPRWSATRSPCTASRPRCGGAALRAARCAWTTRASFSVWTATATRWTMACTSRRARRSCCLTARLGRVVFVQHAGTRVDHGVCEQARAHRGGSQRACCRRCRGCGAGPRLPSGLPADPVRPLATLPSSRAEGCRPAGRQSACCWPAAACTHLCPVPCPTAPNPASHPSRGRPTSWWRSSCCWPT